MQLLQKCFSMLAMNKALQPLPCVSMKEARLCLYLVLATPHSHAARVSLFSTAKVLDVKGSV